MMAAKQITQADARVLVARLTAAGDRLEEINDPAWIPLAQAAATLEALRLGLLEIETHQPAGTEVLAS